MPLPKRKNSALKKDERCRFLIKSKNKKAENIDFIELFNI
jgi:hypothetical protein